MYTPYTGLITRALHFFTNLARRLVLMTGHRRENFVEGFMGDTGGGSGAWQAGAG